LCLATIVIFGSQNSLAGHLLPEFNAIYSLRYLGIKGAEAEYTLKYQDQGYKFTQKTKLVGIVSLFASDTVSAVSEIANIDGQLLLTKHTYIQTGREKNKNERFEISWQSNGDKISGKVSGVVRSKNIELEIDAPVWEILSFQIPLMIEANTDRKEYPYQALLKGEIDTYNFVLNAVKKIEFAGKEYTALQMIRKDPDRNYQLHIWLLPELHNIPVLIENYRDGKVHSSMQLESVAFDNDKALVNNTSENDDFEDDDI